ADLNARAAVTGIKPSLDVLEAATLAYYEMGLKTPGADYAQGNNDLQVAATTVAEFMADYDILLSPTVASPPPLLGVLSLSQDVQDYFKAVTAFIPFTGLQNQTGQPSMSVPLAMSKA